MRFAWVNNNADHSIYIANINKQTKHYLPGNHRLMNMRVTPCCASYLRNIGSSCSIVSFSSFVFSSTLEDVHSWSRYTQILISCSIIWYHEYAATYQHNIRNNEWTTAVTIVALMTIHCTMHYAQRTGTSSDALRERERKEIWSDLHTGVWLIFIFFLLVLCV